MVSYILGVDIGTTTVKAILADREGNVCYAAQTEIPIHYPARFHVEQEPEDWWTALARLTRRMMESLSGKKSPPDILAVGISSQAPVFVPVDTRGNPISRAMIWMDRRADPEAALLDAKVGPDKMLAYSRNRADSFYLASKLLWYRSHKPECYAAVHKLLQANGYIAFRLTGAYSMDEAHAGLTQLYDMNAGRWAADVLDALDISASMFPDVYPGHAVVGAITDEAAGLCGLPSGIPVIAGTVDGVAAALEAGIVQPGIAVEMTGTSSVLMMSSSSAQAAPELITMKHALGDQQLKLAAMSSTGAAMKWFRDRFYAAERREADARGGDVYDRMNAEAAEAKTYNDVIFLPYMVGERSPIWDTDARGVFFGLALHSTRGDLVRAMMEGAAYALRHNLEIMERGDRVADTFRISGGTAKSRVWNQIKADVLGREVEVIDGSAGAPLGVAMLAGLAVGFYTESFVKAGHRSPSKQTYVPSAAMAPFYRKKYELYKELYVQTKQQFRKLSAILKEESE